MENGTNVGTVWLEVDRDHNVWKCAACGELHQFEADGPEENGFQYCPYCGLTITRYVYL